MKQSTVKYTTAALIALLIGVTLSTNLVRAAERPNVLYIMSDDHAAHAISAYGGRLANVAPTPNIDRLAKEGALFTNAFCAELDLFAIACLRAYWPVQPRQWIVRSKRKG